MLWTGSYDTSNHNDLCADGVDEFFLRYRFSVYLQPVAIDKQGNPFIINGPDLNSSIVMTFLYQVWA